MFAAAAVVVVVAAEDEDSVSKNALDHLYEDEESRTKNKSIDI
jgi:hypothetical protein